MITIPTPPRAALLPSLIVLLMVTAPAVPVAAQISYSHTTFINGFNSSDSIWRRHFPDLANDSAPQFLSRSVALKSQVLFNADREKTWSGQVADLYATVGPTQHHVLVAHSMGGLVARGLYLSKADRQANVSGILTIASPHEGTLLADNIRDARDYLLMVQDKVNRGIDAISVAARLEAIFGKRFGPASGPVFITLAVFLSDRGSFGDTINVSQIADLPDVPILPDAKTQSQTVVYLDSLTTDAAIQRGNIVATIPMKNALFRLKQSYDNNDAGFPAAVAQRDQAVAAFRGCQHVAQYVAISGSKASICGRAARSLEGLDDRWGRFVNGSVTKRYVIPIFGEIVVEVARDVPFDGIISNERSVYPGLTDASRNYKADGVNHQNAYSTRASLRRVIEAMTAFGMPQALSVGITGPTTLYDGDTGTWTAVVSNGTPPYSYAWSGMLTGTSPTISGNVGGTLTLTVTDAANLKASASIRVTKSTTTSCGTKKAC